ncbi:596_t:CDS:2, partial [Cetraspora pellucida]
MDKMLKTMPLSLDDKYYTQRNEEEFLNFSNIKGEKILNLVNIAKK